MWSGFGFLSLRVRTAEIELFFRGGEVSETTGLIWSQVCDMLRYHL